MSKCVLRRSYIYIVGWEQERLISASARRVSPIWAFRVLTLNRDGRFLRAESGYFLVLSYIYIKEMDLRLSPLMIVIGRFEMDVENLIGPRYGARSAH